MKGFKDAIRLGTIGDALEEYCQKRGLDPKSDILIWNLGEKFGPVDKQEAASRLVNGEIIAAKNRKIYRRKTVYDINPNPTERWYKVETYITCKACGRIVAGCIILDKQKLSVCDDAGFMFDSQLCDTCANK